MHKWLRQVGSDVAKFARAALTQRAELWSVFTSLGVKLIGQYEVAISAHTINAFSATNEQSALFFGTGCAPASWAAMSAAYGWRSAYSGYMVGKRTSKIEIVLTPHRNLLMEVEGTVVDVDIPAGGTFTLTRQVATLLRLREFSDWVAIDIDALLADTFAIWHPNAQRRLRSTFDGRRRLELEPDIQLLSIAHILRRACVGATSISDVEADTLAHLLVATSWNAPTQDSRRNPLTKAKLDRIFEFVEGEVGVIKSCCPSSLPLWRLARSIFRGRSSWRPVLHLINTFWRGDWNAPRTCCLRPRFPCARSDGPWASTMSATSAASSSSSSASGRVRCALRSRPRAVSR